MRILFIHNFYRKAGGEDQVVTKEMALLKSHGHFVHLLSFENEEFKKSIKGIQQLFYNSESYQQVRETIQQFKPDVIHVHNFFYKASPAIFHAAQSMNIPIIVTLHNYRTICANALLMREAKPCELCIKDVFPIHGIRHKCFQESMVKTALLTATTAWHNYKNTWANYVDRFIVLTSFAQQKFGSSSLGIPEDKFLIKANSVDDYQVVPMSNRLNYAVYVGRLSSEKGIDVLLEGAALSEVTVKIVGDGPLRDMVLDYSNKYKNIEYLGAKDHSQVIEIIQQSRGLILPSVCYEGLPNTVLEGFSTGTPVIVSDNDNLSAIVSNQKNGYTFASGNSSDLAEKLNLLLNNRQQWEKLALHARDTYEQHYTHQQNYRQLITLYEKLIA